MPRCFVTVGTTSFDDLIKMIDSFEVKRVLSDQYGITELVIQYGRGEYQPSLSEFQTMQVDSFRFKPSLHEEMRKADLIISHAGAGSVMEALRLRKRLVVVVNDSLMDNHQIELASALAKKNYLAFASSPKELVEVLNKSAPLDSLDPYPERDTLKFSKMLQEELKI